MPNDFDTYRWRTSKLIDLVEQSGPDTRLRLVEWHIMSDNEAFFNFNETEFATCVHKLITPTHAYSCMESHGTLLTSVDIFQEDVGPKEEGPSKWAEKLPFYHSKEKCSITDLPCANLKSCSENSLNRDQPEVKLPTSAPPMGSMASFMQNYSQSLQNRMSRSSRLWSETSSSIRPFGSYVTPRLILGRNPAVPATSFSYQTNNYVQEFPLYDYPVAQTPIPYNRLVHTPMTHQAVPRLQETMPDDDPAFDDLPELA